MKMRKLFAGIAAAATLLGGMALGTTSAQADDAMVTDNATFTFTAETEEQLTHANLAAYKIGDYVQYGSDQSVAYGVVTNSANKAAVDSALKAAGVDTADPKVDHLAAALNAGTLDVSDSRPWDKNAAGGASTTRAFANALEKEKLANGTTVKFAATSGSAEDGYSATVTLPAGIYVFIDSAAATDSVTKAIPMIVASGTVNTEKKVLTDPIQGANTVNMKNTNNPGKTKEVNNTSAAIGDTLTYTLTGTIANPAPTEFKFTDKPGKGLTIKAGTFKFYVNGEEISAETAASDFTVPTADVTGGDNASFNVTVNNPSKYAGKTIKVTFQAVINDEADAENGVVNKLDNYGTDVEAPTKFTGFNFTKVDPDDKGIKDVTFQVKDGDTTLYFVKQGDGSYKKAASANTQGATTDVTTGTNGQLSFTGLDKTKIYTVTETVRASDAYLNIMPSFTVSFNEENGSAVLAKTTTSDPWGLVNTTAKTVKNIKSITQLPLTGAAGTMLFTVVALLVAGAGVTIAIKSRQNAEA
ncbi:isopeptide-forming domain-containing fimbrial protein [Bifidobacterium adolescentis]|uniref:isopeptide-forming domain-containing fimbrial protein n=1 Tax=Bifidobacterium adolescentis TaxID=1680 RepID=UPI0018A0F083|nr:isopeptide-forming domain-containing fimbrial protein [Bifidobacterium adolescentis]MDB0656368.1 isopeptide-forming domain-containing fimbrial protein [Bifidobacterium adolescentis]MDB0661006.1 isopeptide-forming domain-containing fimbrial protein [Bifidobacterium adolescentis]MDB0662705.1 isopeptide-forming domain-containing fimbrial protein [Bifidobacterium adolescentis]MDB1344683.1 isopeptide-forming domain-containing fimbrial protein [Bifidobacterium adolescentis]MDB1347441.1 isopeptide